MAISLTKDDISQLRRADSIVVRFDTREEPLGFSRIEGSIQAPGERRFTDPERLFEMPSNPVSVTNYGDDRIEAGCWIISPAKFVPEWATMLNLLRTGDELHSTFEADCNYHAKGDVRRQADAVIVDTFAMRVMRPSPSGGRDKLLVFNLGYQLTGRSDGVRIRNLYTAGRSR